MKQKLVSIVLVLSMALCMFTACGKDSEAISQSNKGFKNFTEAVKAFKETYNTFYDEHRMNGSYTDSTLDCFANVYVLGDTPTMLIMDIIQTEQLTEYDTSYIADFYMFEFVDGKVKESAKYLSVSLGRFFTTYIYPLQDKLFMGYYVPKDEPDSSSYFEYKVGVFNEYFEDVEEEWVITEVLSEGKVLPYPSPIEDVIDGLIDDVAEYSDFDSYNNGFGNYYAGISSVQAGYTKHYKTGLGKDGFGGSALLIQPEYIFDNYVFASCRGGIWGLNSVNFSKYLDFLSTQEITNNAQLMLQHAKYFETIGITQEQHLVKSDYGDFFIPVQLDRPVQWIGSLLFDALVRQENPDADLETISKIVFEMWNAAEENKINARVPVEVWLDGFYYLVFDNNIFLYAYDIDSATEDYPKKVFGYDLELTVHRDSNVEYNSISLEEAWKKAEEIYNKSK